MAGISNYLKDYLLNCYFRDATFTKPGSVAVALYSAMPNDAGTGGTELSAGNYARATIDTTNAAWDAPAAGAGTIRYIQNTATVSFGTANANWAPSGTPAVGFAFWDGANYLGGNTFAAPQTITTGRDVSFAAGELEIQLAGS